MSRQMLSEVAYRALKEQIAGLSGGSYLSARQSAKKLGMSYTPVREAFLRLQKEGTLRQVPNVGFFVESVSLSDLLQVFQIRECIEGYCLQKTFLRFGEEQLRQMERLCEEQREAMSQGDSYRYFNADAAFHAVAIELLGNEKLTELYQSCRAQYMICSSQLYKALDEETTAEHLLLIEAVREKNLEKAQAAQKNHLNNMKLRMMDSYRNGIL